MQRGVLGARSLNADLQKALNPNAPNRVERFGSVFLTGDKVMQTENDYDKEVFNGDLGTVASIDEDEGVLIANFDGRAVEYAFGELDTLVPAYATTIHKSQGSEYPAVVITLRHPALHHAGPQPALHGGHSRQEAGHRRRPASGTRDSGPDIECQTTLDEARRVARAVRSGRRDRFRRPSPSRLTASRRSARRDSALTFKGETIHRGAVVAKSATRE
jgi:hypothetical protein